MPRIKIGKEQFKGIRHAFLDQAAALQDAKAHDYHNPEDDYLAKFYEAADRLGITALQDIGVHIDKHYGALMSGIRGKDLKVEDLRSHATDLVNYLSLLVAINVVDIKEKDSRNHDTARPGPRRI